MPARARRIDPEKYAHLIAASLPIPPRNEADNARLIELLSEMDERERLTAEEEAFAELLAIVVEDFENKQILNGRRKISMALAKRLALHLHVPVELFV